MTGRRWIILAVVVIGVMVQFVRPPVVNPPVVAELNVPANVKEVFTTSCYNCHSNQTRLSWFDQIVPAYWLVAKDVSGARQHLNFSEMQQVQGSAQQDLLFEITNQIQAGIMPPRRYTLLHPEAKITAQKLQLLKAYLDPYRTRPASSAAQFAAVIEEYEKWIGGRPPQDVANAPNGIAFIPEYKNWKAISSTERFDNQTIRLVLGNNVAIKAIENNTINPWPDGTIFAKVAWDRLTDDSGSAQPGQFKQVEFMIKDSRKFASSLGWGFARWRGANLQPFGNDAGFVQGCVDCHLPMTKRDFVFTDPVKTLPQDARVIAIGVSTQDATMFTLFGNDFAVMHSRTNPKEPYPAGSVLSLVTWTQQEDPRWFGAKIPGALKSVESVTVPADDRDPRINQILQRKALVMP